MSPRAPRFLAVSVALAVASTCVPVPAFAGPTGGALPPELVKILDVAGQTSVPTDAAMVALNITATRAAGTGFFTAYPCDGDQPHTSNVNYVADQNVPNLAITRIADDGTVCVGTSAVSDLVVDVIGYVPAGSRITPLAQPVRALDTRTTRTPAGGETVRVSVADVPGVDPGADLVMANVTAIARGETSYLTVHPCVTPTPATSSANVGRGQISANFVVSRMDSSGAICITPSRPTDIVVDVAATATAGIRTLPTPVRLVDTRTTARRTAGSTLELDIAGRANVPDGATAAVYNLTAANAAAIGYATSHPCQPAAPTASNLNYAPGPARANGTITKLSDAGRLCITTSHAVDLIVDLIGYTVDTTDYVPLSPTRILDTRVGWQPTCDWVAPRSLRNGRIEAMNVRTDARRQLDAVPGAVRGVVTRLGQDCGAFHVYVNHDEGPPAMAGLYRVGLDGSRARLLPAIEGAWLTDVGRNEFDGFVGVDGDGGVWSLETGELHLAPLEPMYDPDHDWSSFGEPLLSADGLTMVRSTGRFLEIHDLTADVQLATVEFDRWIEHVAVSPDGVYVSVALDRFARRFGYDLQRPYRNVVLTRFGDIVDELPSRGEVFEPFPLPATFIGDRTLAVCSVGTGIFLRDLFGTAIRTVSEDQLRGPSGVEVQVCPVEGSRGMWNS